MNKIKLIAQRIMDSAMTVLTVFFIGYNAYNHNFQLLFLTIVTFMNSVGIGVLLNKLKIND